MKFKSLEFDKDHELSAVEAVIVSRVASVASAAEAASMEVDEKIKVPVRFRTTISDEVSEVFEDAGFEWKGEEATDREATPGVLGEHVLNGLVARIKKMKDCRHVYCGPIPVPEGKLEGAVTFLSAGHSIEVNSVNLSPGTLEAKAFSSGSETVLEYLAGQLSQDSDYLDTLSASYADLLRVIIRLNEGDRREIVFFKLSETWYSDLELLNLDPSSEIAQLIIDLKNNPAKYRDSKDPLLNDAANLSR